MEELKNENSKKNNDIKSLINQLVTSNDIQEYKYKIMKRIEINSFLSIKNDKKAYLLLIRTYYLNEFDKIEKAINNKELLNKNLNLSNEQYLEIFSYLNTLLSLEDLYIYKIDSLKSLQLQSKIINNIKSNFINKNDFENI